MKMRCILACVFIMISFVSMTANALMPPMSKEDLNAESTNIVDGVILDVKCTGEFEETHCAKKTGYVATIAVKKTIKGDKHKTLNLYFKHYEFKDGCVGSPDTLHYADMKALFYLQCKKERCSLTHWNGVEYKNKGFGVLPGCKK